MSERCVAPRERAAVFSAVCVTLAAAAHGLMEHRAVPVWACLLGFVAVFGLARSATTRECGLPIISALMGGAQVGLHVLFEAAQPGRATVIGAMPGMAHGHAPTVAMASGTMHLTGGMLAGHAVAALVLAWWLRRGEAAVFALARALRLKAAAVWALLLFLPSDAILLPIGHRAYGLVATEVGRGRQAIRFAVVRRGPPGVGLLV